MFGLSFNDAVTAALALGIIVALADRVWQRLRQQSSGFEGSAAQAVAPAKHLVEKDYQRMAAEQLKAAGLDPQLEVVLDDGARVDICTKTHAIEVDFPHKWAECIGQALYYAVKTGKAPVCLLVVGLSENERGVDRCVRVCKLYRIQVWQFDATTLELRR